MSDSELKRAVSFIDEYTRESMRRSRVPGFSLAIVQGGRVVYANGFGFRDLEGGLPATPHTLYGIGSCTKSFAATAIMQLVEKGEIRLDDPVSLHLPLRIGLPGEPITVRHLLTHTSGIPNLLTSALEGRRGGVEAAGIPWGGVEDFYRFINGAEGEIVAEPGGRFLYLNAGYRMLGHIVQRVSGMAFDAYVAENIFRPLGMTRSTFSRRQFEAEEDRMTPYRRRPDGSLVLAEYPRFEVADDPDFSFTAAAGGALSSATELASYLIANVSGGRLGSLRLLSEESVEEMQRIHVQIPRGHFGGEGYGYGWFVTESFLGQRMVHHQGSTGVSTAYLALLPEAGVGVAMASNAPPGYPNLPLAQGFLAALMGEDPRMAVPAIRIEERLEGLTGTYETYRGLARVRVVSREGLLHLEQGDGSSSLPLIPVDDGLESYRFYTLLDGLRQPVEFILRSPSEIDLYVERNRYHHIYHKVGAR